MERINLNDFWQETVEVWRHGLWGVDISQIIVALGVLFFFLVLRGVLSKYIIDRLRRVTARTANHLDDQVLEALTPPLHFVPVVMGIFFAGQALELGETAAVFFGRFMRSLIAFALFWGLYRSLEPLLHMSRSLKKVMTPAMLEWMFRFLRVAVALLGAAVILEVWGIAVGPLLAGLGLFGMAVALGAQDVFKNLIAGITLIAERRFSTGDWILVEGVVEGTVETVGFRSTQVRRFDKSPVYVPNASLADKPLTNFSRMTHRRIYWKISLEYRTTTEQLKIIRDEIRAYLAANKAFAPAEEVATLIYVDDFNSSSIDLMVYCFTRTIVWSEWLAAKEDLAFAIKDIVENRAGARFALPTRSLYVESWPGQVPPPQSVTGVLPEEFMPPA